jgi:hypothetical protein
VRASVRKSRIPKTFFSEVSEGQEEANRSPDGRATAAFATQRSAQAGKPASPQKTEEIHGIISYRGPNGTAGVEVYMAVESSRARIKPSGEFTLRFLPPASYSLVLELPHHPSPSGALPSPTTRSRTSERSSSASCDTLIHVLRR